MHMHVFKLYFMLILCTFVNTVSIVPKCSISGQHQARSSGCGASKHEDKLGTRHLHYTEERKNIKRIENRKNGWVVLKKRERVWAMCKPQKIMERKSEWCKRRRLGKRQGKSIWSEEHQKKRKSNGVCGSHSGNGQSGGVGVVPNSRFSPITFIFISIIITMVFLILVVAVVPNTFIFNLLPMVLVCAHPYLVTMFPCFSWQRWASSMKRKSGRELWLLAPQQFRNRRTISWNECLVAQLLSSFHFSKWSKRLLSLAGAAGCRDERRRLQKVGFMQLS